MGGFNQFAGEVGEQLAKRVSKYASATSSGARGIGRKAAITARSNGMTTAVSNRTIGYGAMGGAAGGAVYGANRMRRKSKSTT